MRVAVITPYYQEPIEYLQRCIQSVREQSYSTNHFLVADGHPQNWLDHEGVRHIKLDQPCRDYGDTPRGIGALLAVSSGYDAIAFLDADNWYLPNHVELCLQAAQKYDADLVIARRHIVRHDGSIMPFDLKNEYCLPVPKHVDPSCFFLLKGAFHTISRWITMPAPLHKIDDRIFWRSLQNDHLKAVITNQVTVNYLNNYVHYAQACGEAPPPNAKAIVNISDIYDWAIEQSDEEIQRIQQLIGLHILNDLGITKP